MIGAAVPCDDSPAGDGVLDLAYCSQRQVPKEQSLLYIYVHMYTCMLLCLLSGAYTYVFMYLYFKQYVNKQLTVRTFIWNYLHVYTNI